MTALYHYCSNSNFISIILSRSIWLSSLTLSNDTMEGKLVAEIIDRLARRDGLDESAIKNIQSAVRILEEVCDGLGFCLSEHGDLLSQWRGYAYDATGFSIGFSKEYFQAFSEHLTAQKQSTFSIQKVKYDFEAQEEVVKPTYDEVRKIYDSGRMTPPYPPTLLGFKSDSDYEKGPIGPGVEMWITSPVINLPTPGPTAI